ncbi:DUF6585 family protein [Streptomyces sp. NPDC049555]|uniref:DUF6585 family protein n=1 Tax=Streptomyces sp. NPDC049555 TaxID=3154930 RepID=UPI0034155A48
MTDQFISNSVAWERIRLDAESAGLGEHCAVYWPLTCYPPGKQRRVGIGAVVCLALSVALVNTTLWILTAFTAPFAAVCALGWLIAVRTDRRNAGARLDLFEHGLVFTGPGTSLHVHRWDAVSVLERIRDPTRNSLYYGRTWIYTLIAPGGRAVRIRGGMTEGGGIANVEQWGPAILRAVTEAQLPGALAALEQGRTLEFGSLAVSRDAVTALGVSVAWAQTGDVTYKGGDLIIKAVGGRRTLVRTSVLRIPNHPLLDVLIRHLRDSARQS